ncbi:MAG: hypothetical protein WCO33_04825, partial [bacterium]
LYTLPILEGSQDEFKHDETNYSLVNVEKLSEEVWKRIEIGYGLDTSQLIFHPDKLEVKNYPLKLSQIIVRILFFPLIYGMKGDIQKYTKYSDVIAWNYNSISGRASFKIFTSEKKKDKLIIIVTEKLDKDPSKEISAFIGENKKVNYEIETAFKGRGGIKA